MTKLTKETLEITDYTSYNKKDNRERWIQIKSSNGKIFEGFLQEKMN